MKPCTSRRSFLKTAVLGMAALGLPRWHLGAETVNAAVAGDPTAVALTTGGQRADLAFRALAPFRDGIRRAIGNKRVMLKPNNVSIDTPLSATHAETIEGILEFLKSIDKLDHAIIAESAASGPTLDGFEGMEGNGPVGGTPVDHRVCVASPDWLAADRVAVELMGIDYAKVGYLNYCGRAGLGQDDLAKIEVVGEPIARHIKPYRLSDNIDQQLVWMNSAS